MDCETDDRQVALFPPLVICRPPAIYLVSTVQDVDDPSVLLCELDYHLGSVAAVTIGRVAPKRVVLGIGV